MRLLIALLITTGAFVAVSIRALTDSVSEFDLFKEDDTYDDNSDNY